MVIIAGKSSVAASRLLWKQQGKPLLALISSTNFVPTPSSSRQQQGFHSYASPFQFQATSTSKEQRRCLSSGKRDFYQVLGVPKGSDKATIKKAYFKLAKEHHPDTNQGDAKSTEKFKEVTEAYEVLSDDKQREMYDQFGHAGVDPSSGFGEDGGNPFHGFDFNDGSFHFSSSGSQSVDAEELFEAFFGGGGRRRKPRGPRRGSDLQMHVTLSFEEAAFGTKKDLNLRYQVMNSTTGKVEIKDRDVTVDIPAGVDSGMNLRLQGQGAEGDPGASRGNLMVTIIVQEDKYFHREGLDVFTEVPISVAQAILGGTVDVKTLTGEVEMKIPKGCQIDTKLMLRGKGIAQLHGKAKGNHIVHLKIQIPKSLNSRQEGLIREFDEETRACGNGISGKIAHMAGTVFERVFGKKGDDEWAKKGSETEKKVPPENDDDEPPEKKQATQ